MGESNNFEQFDIILGAHIEEQSFLFSNMPGCIIKKKKETNQQQTEQWRTNKRENQTLC